MEIQHNNSIPRIGDMAPDFEAVTTTGNLKFSFYSKDSWVIFFSHPADFTPVCTTEMIGFAKEKDFFESRNTKLIGLSIDSIHAHIAWINAVQEKTGILFEFPIIADIDTKVSQLYGMLQPGESQTEAVRAVFFIDPNRYIRLIMYYPMNIGRSMDEIKRVIIALQTSEEHKCSLPLDWKPGEMVVLPAPKTVEGLIERKKSPHDMVDWYLAKKVIQTDKNQTK